MNHKISSEENRIRTEIAKLRNEMEALSKQAKELEELRKNDWVEFLKENKLVVLDLIDHDRSSCSDEDPCNGLEPDGSYKCSKCALIDILTSSTIGISTSNYDIHFTVSVR